MKLILFALALFMVVIANAQKSASVNQRNGKNSNGSVSQKPMIYNFVEQMPKADYDLNTYLSANLKYPDSAGLHNIEGRVIIDFVVNEDGSIADCQVARSIGGGCDEEALRVIKNMPAWKPGRKNGMPVKVKYTLPVSFKLEDGPRIDESKHIKKVDSQQMPLTYVEQMPKPTFGINEYLGVSLHYPDLARRKNIEGRVIVSFVISKDGSIRDCKVVRGIGGGCDEEALRVVKNMPPWIPGSQNGKKVSVLLTLPILFKLY